MIPIVNGVGDSLGGKEAVFAAVNLYLHLRPIILTFAHRRLPVFLSDTSGNPKTSLDLCHILLPKNPTLSMVRAISILCREHGRLFFIHD